MEKFFGMDAQKYQQLSALITEVFSVLSDNKNKTPEELARDIFVFISAVKDYDIEVTKKAFEQYMRHNMVIPCPSVIITIIDPKDRRHKPIEDFVEWSRIQERKNGKLLFGGMHQ
jgi:hypothetical protein